MVTAADAARYLVRAFIKRKAPLSHLKLQKLLYYAQAWHLGLYGHPLFADPVQAWVHGPVVPSVFHNYRDLRWSPIVSAPDPNVPPDVAAHLDKVADAYGHLSALQLERLSHGEEPWIKARQGLTKDAPSTNAISHETLRDYFAQLTANA